MISARPEAEVLAALTRWGAGQPALRAMIMTSSRAVPGAPVDLLTDYDVILSLRDIQPFFDDRAWLEAFGRLLVVYRDPLEPYCGFLKSSYVTQYEDGLKIDFTLWPVEILQHIAAEPQLPDEFDAGYRVLLDKDHLAAGLKPPTFRAYIPAPPTEAQYLEHVELIFQEATYVAKYLWRGDLMAARHSFDFVYQDHLRPMLEWHYESEHEWAVKPGPFGRRLQRWLRPDLWAEVEGTYVGAGLDENWEALFRLLALFRKVALEVGHRLGYRYPQELHERGLAYLQAVRQLPAAS